MTFAIALVIIILIAAVIFTLLLTGKSDEGYSSATKKNTANLTYIYIIAILLSVAALAVYIYYFT
ncbi:hypothetical protein J7I93_19385 [Bacillus sp. ISL-47]|uniref:hypothetical protein n=1 Tax=Bacillus sp. ISL-47 TaxID=2819130 RepID=UPI001BEBAF63|nr:hypothetical protein [Bacillus sp. ISL-47]MBT2690319.1 hypothetical protein [Bacillus sp. ISL-47]